MKALRHLPFSISFTAVAVAAGQLGEQYDEPIASLFGVVLLVCIAGAAVAIFRLAGKG